MEYYYIVSEKSKLPLKIYLTPGAGGLSPPARTISFYCYINDYAPSL
jgi:hypothetical protein